MPALPDIAYSSANDRECGRDFTFSIQKALDDFELIANKIVLDVGCGPGYYTLKMIDWGARMVIGTDPEPSTVEKAKVTAKTLQKSGARFLCLPAEDLDLLKATVDVAVSFHVLQFITNRDVLFQVMRNIYDLLSDGGVFVGIVPNSSRSHAIDNGAILSGKEDGNKEDEQMTINFYENGEVVGTAEVRLHSKNTYEMALRRAGFSRVEWFNPSADPKDAFVHESMVDNPTEVIFRAWK